MKKDKVKASNASWHSCQYHIVFCTKYRRRILVDEIAKRTMALFRLLGKELGCEVIGVYAMPDRVNALIDVPPTKNLSKLIGNLKGRIAHELKMEFPALRTRLPSVWTRNNYICSVGTATNESINVFVERQNGL